MKKYGSAKMCPKCSYDAFGDKWVPGSQPHPTIEIPEHIERKCWRCGYQVCELTIDSAEEEK